MFDGRGSWVLLFSRVIDFAMRCMTEIALYLYQFHAVVEKQALLFFSSGRAAFSVPSAIVLSCIV